MATKKIALDDFIERNSLIPITDLEQHPLKPQGFSLGPLQTQIRQEGMDPGDFFYNPNNPELPFCYYRGVVLLDLAQLDGKIADALNIIQRTEKDLNESVAKRDFDRFLSLIDERLAPDLFMEIFNFIPDDQKYRLFERVCRYNPNSRQVFTDDFIDKANKYKGVTASRPVADDQGFVEVYRGQSTKKNPPRDVRTWTVDINRAIKQALAFNPAGNVFKGRVHLDNITDYNMERYKKEVLINAFKVEELELMPLIKLEDFDNQLKTGGVIADYYTWVGKINNNWFHNPQGIHALSHTKRVLLLCLLISYLEKYAQEDKVILCMAAIYHDIGRLTDGYDPDHGMASYDKVLEEKLTVADNPQDAEMLRFIVQNHAIPDQSAYKKLGRYDIDDVDRTWRLYDAFKDADGLDRVRINDLNPEYLRTPSAHRLLMLAHQLYNMQEYENLGK